jgi:cell division cycle protein 20 (cofactor of APC complex)
VKTTAASMSSLSSLAAGGGIGRNGVVNHDFELSSAETGGNTGRKSPSKKGKHVSEQEQRKTDSIT